MELLRKRKKKNRAHWKYIAEQIKIRGIKILITQTGYWKLKLQGSPVTKNIKVFFVTLDEDGDLFVKNPAKKWRAIAETDTDGTFVITTREVEESEKIKKIDRFSEVLCNLLYKR